VDEKRAKQIGQKVAFNIDASRMGLLPLNSVYFPELIGNQIKKYGNDQGLLSATIKRQADLIAAGFSIDKVDGRVPPIQPK
jgi:hypothetical protein